MFENLRNAKRVIEPRWYPAPERFADYVGRQNPDELARWAHSVHEHIESGMSPEAVAEISVEEGWDKEVAEWLCGFTHAQRRPVIPMLEATLVEERNLVESTIYYRWMGIWGSAYLVGLVALVLCLPIGMDKTSGTAMFVWFLGTLYCGYRYFALWAERNGYSEGFGWLTLVPAACIPLVWLAWALSNV